MASENLDTRSLRSNIIDLYQRPDRVKDYFLNVFLPANKQMIRSGRIIDACAYSVAQVGFSGVYNEYLGRISDESGCIKRDIHNNTMFLPTYDPGISRELILWGEHEPTSTAIFSRKLEEMSELVDNISVLEIGGNIGYYTLIEATCLNQTDQILVAEPVPSNIELLRKNIEKNSHSNKVRIRNIAVGDSNGSDEMYLSKHSNCGRVGEAPSHIHDDEIITIEKRTVAKFLEEENLSPQDINVARMDVEGYESVIFGELSGLFNDSDPFLLFIEIHNNAVNDGLLPQFIEEMKENDFELVNGCNDTPGNIPSIDIQSIEDLYEYNFEKLENIDLILKKDF